MAEMRRIYSSTSVPDVHIARSLLAGEGVTVELRNEFLRGARGELPAEPLELWVPEDEVATAVQILEGLEAGPPESDPSKAWTCAKCGEVMEEQFTACWRCRTERDGGST